eukprot:CAMPEP_0201930774 /NCGR_PEP_ID=MMETSP0903-20130614/25826_1 /ASSEMBLY_ACC=CAM_ASM_000552 /TAXON_ID=420261 /ORGANISM="Thalassiosira antarctica, Strain CCMP982" /LENGTH=277 /DNA_ID=CAMNT_0048469911 /DNA_START=39 /DNA_END=868 /DNA_ORIENTATION=-
MLLAHATEDIKEGTDIFREFAFFPNLQQKLLQFVSRSAPTGDPATDAEIQSLLRLVRMTAQRNPGKAHLNNEYPPKARAALDKVNMYANLHEFNLQPESVQKKWLSLHDAFQVVPLNMETPVGIFGLKSPKGKQLNNTIGTSLGTMGASKNEGRFRVRTVRKNETGDIVTEDLWTKKENLKTVHGTCCSNAFTSGLFEKICRINHSCRPNTKIRTVTDSEPEEYAVIAFCDIEAGEGLTLSYLQQRSESRSTEIRREELLEKYGFRCECEACERNES